MSKLILKDRSNTGRILNILEKNGLITREIDTKQKRLVKKIYITKKGEKLWEEIQPELRKEFSFIYNDVSKEEFETLKKLLTKFRNSLSKNTNIQI